MDRVGHQLGNYQLLRLLGSGGFAEVYLGEHIHLGTQAAIKVLSAKLNTEEIAHFREEARTIARLKHPSIVRVLEFGVEADAPYLVMEHAPHGTLRQRHPKGTRLEPADLLPYVQQVAAALQYAHEHKVIHRDVKPENMLIGESDEVLLSDFGIAIVAQSSRYQTTQDVVGTFAYMAPEQIQAHPQPASDQYALGIVIYEWLAGERPFQGSMSEVLAKQITAAPPPLRDKLPALPPLVEEVVFTALAKDPKARFGSVRACANALAQAILGNTAQPTLSEPLSFGALPTVPSTPEQSRPSDSSVLFAPTRVPPHPPAEQPTTPAKSPPTIEPTLTGEIASGRLTPSQPLTVFETQPARTEPGRATGTHRDAPPRTPVPPPSEPRPSLNLSRRQVIAGLAGLAVVGGGATATLLALAPRPQKGGASTQSTASIPASNSPPTSTPNSASPGTTVYTYRGHTGYVNAVAWSSDSRRVASGGDTTAQVWDALTGDNAVIYRGHTNAVLAVAYSPDGSRVVSGAVDTTAQVWDATTGALVLNYRGHTNAVRFLAWSSDGSRIASGSWDGTVHVWDANTGDTLVVYRGHSSYVNVVAWSPDGQSISSGAGTPDTRVQVWDASTGNTILTYTGHSDGVLAVPWSHDGRYIASGGGDKTVQVWDSQSGRPLFTYRGNAAPVWGIAWSPDGKRIASGGGTLVQVWDAFTGNNVLTYHGHTLGLLAVAWSPNGKYIVSGDEDTTAQVWVAS